ARPSRRATDCGTSRAAARGAVGGEDHGVGAVASPRQFLLRGRGGNKVGHLQFSIFRGCDEPLGAAQTYTPDAEILAWAATEGRTLLTHDRDTMPRRAYDRMISGQVMPGVFLVSDRTPIGQAVDEILLAVDCLAPEECTGFVRFFPL